MNYIILGSTLLISVIISFVGFELLLRKKFFTFLRKRNIGGERWASQRKPIFGGVMFYISFLVGLLISLLTLDFSSISSSYMGLVLMCLSISFFMGLLDDIQNQGPINKFIVQLSCAILLIYFDAYIQTSDNNIINYTLTIFWVVGIMNSINMLDNMDAITGSVSTIILIAIAGILITMGKTNSFDLIIIISIIGSLLAYLYYNWHPSKMYMGDNGSQFLGIFLAIISIKYVWNSSPDFSGFSYREFLLSGLMFLLPIIDTTTVSINRLSEGKSPFVGDRFHTTHNLVYMGLSERAVAVVFIIISLISSFSVYYIISFTDIIIHINYYYLLLIFAIIIAATFFIISRVVKKQKLCKK